MDKKKSVFPKKALSYAITVFAALIIIASFSHEAYSVRESYFEAEYLRIKSEIKGTIYADYTGSSRLNELKANLSLYPKHEFGILYSQNYNPLPYSISDDHIIFRWAELNPEYHFEVNSESRHDFISGNIAWRTPYPQTFFPQEYKIYTGPSDFIDSDNPSIINLAVQIAEGHTDMLELQMELAEYVRKNIRYDLATLDQEASLKASEVLASGEGVCREITLLFIALNRALGIPARYVSGYSYTDIFTSEGSWAGHAWAEIYIGNQWVPFDLTYAEYMHVSPIHVVFKKSLDPVESRTTFEWIGRNVNIRSQPLDIKITVTEESNPIRFGTIEAEFIMANVGRDSYNVLKVTAKNNMPFAIMPKLTLSRTRGLKSFEQEKFLLLYPYEQKEAYFLVQVEENLRRGFVYTFPMAAVSRGFETAGASFSASANSFSYSMEDFSAHLSSDERVKQYVNTVTAECDFREKYKANSNQEINCKISNLGNKNYDSLQLCIDECTVAVLKINEEKNVTVPFFTGTGEQTKALRIRDETIISTYPFTYRALNPASVTIFSEQIDENRIRLKIEASEFITSRVILSSAAGKTIEYQFNGTFIDEEIAIPKNFIASFESRMGIEVHYEDIEGKKTEREELPFRIERNISNFLSIMISRILNFFIFF